VYIGPLEPYIIASQTGIPQDVNIYLLGVTIFLTWIYRFGYPASNRIAKGAGLHLGERDIGSEMMRGVLGWFFRLNILLSLYLIFNQVLTIFVTYTIAGVGGYVISYYLQGLALAAPPILFAILVLPILEDFAVVFYKKVFPSSL